MAPKKTKEHSNDLRQTVIKHFLNGDTERDIVTKVLIPRTSIHYIIAKCLIQRKIKANRRILSLSVKVELQNDLNINISETTIRRRAHEGGLFGRVARKKPYVNKT
ncbi:unnamed protein product [Rotaria sp. Silwood2]|nr:unnamed protein product [Rotaria sp. Silwood2]CAF4427608.1 unnamed protein product [Rotaria sp. Silwood2]CAF4479746.1 unnamed protein product [Rotaria sp. Silwood2]